MGGRFAGKKEKRLRVTDKCYFCKGKVVERQITIGYRWGDTLVVIKEVYWFVKKNIPFFGKYIPRSLDYVLGRLVG